MALLFSRPLLMMLTGLFWCDFIGNYQLHFFHIHWSLTTKSLCSKERALFIFEIESLTRGLVGGGGAVGATGHGRKERRYRLLVTLNLVGDLVVVDAWLDGRLEGLAEGR